MRSLKHFFFVALLRIDNAYNNSCCDKNLYKNSQGSFSVEAAFHTKMADFLCLLRHVF